ncbi:membrane protein [Megasphaera cerevisiae DSM 20462]|uniref:Membrane protein n=1 Tax=Megasphaera cerevisiae DSM 20462 TaxID=1122219 RepID=A0A0J6WPH9_9FIRM|nr:YoaK family protein [Megasphaera cerevisiae]KMO85310.1 membrane protein [Megasphaera cerevisiae DSM 20462]MCI1750482.1 DUF1275 domain-containing protein [Megasphaera cerevisiae]OKY52484.1 hypothetical protein BSR42_12645 [Megasphaera cerevisiae]SKA23909.1 Uncharacterized membrane protein YoaK, UPF0700 family [Megasphaera cerevisiae DSM 20462]
MELLSKKRHERILFGALLTMAAGGIDAYSYIAHGGVFAGLQTGNLILLGIHLGQKDIPSSLSYMLSLAAFFLGTVIVRFLQQHPKLSLQQTARHQIILLYEGIILLCVAIISPFVSDSITTILLSVTAAAELQEFRTLNGAPFTPLMMTGNLRTLAETSVDSLIFHHTEAQQTLFNTAIIMLTFAFGAALVAIATPVLKDASVILPALPLFGAWIFSKKASDL